MNDKLREELGRQIGYDISKKDVKIGAEVENTIGNIGWKHIAGLVDDSEAVLKFEENFGIWQKQAILLTEITYAEDYNYVTPLGVFTNIGTLARALQRIFDKDWDIDAQLIGDELSFLVNKHIEDFRYSFVCRYIELDQAYSQIHCDGWKFTTVIGIGKPQKEFFIPYSEAMNVINSLSFPGVLQKPEESGITADQVGVTAMECGYLLTIQPQEEPQNGTVDR